MIGAVRGQAVRAARAAVAALAFASWAMVLGGAAACGSDPAPVAELIDAEGPVQQSPAAAPPRWAEAAVGHRFARGAGVRTGADARARLRVHGSGTLRMGASSVVWFGRGADADDAGASGSGELLLEAGDAEIEAGAAEVVIGTEAGPARIRPGARVRLAQGPKGAQLVVEVGAAQIERGDEAPMEVAAGSAVDLRALGPARRRRDAGSRDAGARTEAAPVDAGTPLSDMPDGGPPADLAVDLPGGSLDLDPQPRYADFAVRAGESATVHDPSPPTNVRLQFGQLCDRQALVEVQRGRSRIRVLDNGSAVVALVAGSHAYTVRCRKGGGFDSKPEGRGTLRVVRDAGRRKIATRAPRNTIEADGRNYKVLYQNRLPILVMRWPDAPSAAAYTLTVDGGGGKPRRFPSRKPEVALASGSVGEGSFRFWFAVDGSEVRSAETQLTIDFDNAAPIAQLLEPAATSAWSDNIQVGGVATEGATVSVGGVELPLDAHYRFSGQVAVPDGERAIAVRIAQKERGVHYYVRRRK